MSDGRTDETLELGRIFLALRHGLSQYYRNLHAHIHRTLSDSHSTPEPESQTLWWYRQGDNIYGFPFLHSYPQEKSSDMVEFKYVTKLTDFKYKVQEVVSKNLIFVKFACQWDPDIHQLLVTHNLAPPLLHCGAAERYGEHILVVTEWVLQANHRHRTLNPSEYKELLQTAVDLIHNAGYVMGPSLTRTRVVPGGLKFLNFSYIAGSLARIIGSVWCM